MNDYDIIYLGYPNWWGTFPMAVFTFLESYDFSGKTIIPFCTHVKLNESSEKVINLIRSNPYITIPEIAISIGISS